MLAANEIDVAVAQVFRHEINAGHTVPYLSFDENCFYRRWALDVCQEDGTVFETVLECGSSAGIIMGVCSGLGVALLSGRHLTGDMEIISNRFPAPPDVAYVIRVSRKSRSQAVDSLVNEITLEVGRYGKLRVV